MSSGFVYACYSEVLGFGAFLQFVLVQVVEGILLKFKGGGGSPVGSIKAYETTTIDAFWVADFCTNENCKHCLWIWSEADSCGSLILTYTLRSTEFGCRHIRCCCLCCCCATHAGPSGAGVETGADVLISPLVKTFFICSPLKNMGILLLGKYRECFCFVLCHCITSEE